MLKDEFAILSGRLTGIKHIQDGGNCQDYIGYKVMDNIILMAHSDGVGSGVYSEVGACLIVDYAIDTMEYLFRLYLGPDDMGEQTIRNFLLFASARILGKIRNLIKESRFDPVITAEDTSFIKRYMQATLNIAIITPSITFTGHIGDGYLMFNDEYIDLPDVEESTRTGGPKCLVHSLINPKEPSFLKLGMFAETKDVKELLIGGDGIVKFNNAASRDLPRNPESSPQGDIFQFKEERYINNPRLVQRRLSLIGARNNAWPDDDVAFCWARRIK